jgi:uncharacterized membrane protein (DUF485 family)
MGVEFVVVLCFGLYYIKTQQYATPFFLSPLDGQGVRGIPLCVIMFNVATTILTRIL